MLKRATCVTQELRASADREITDLLAEANSESEQIRGQGDTERNAIFAPAFGRDPDFSLLTGPPARCSSGFGRPAIVRYVDELSHTGS